MASRRRTLLTALRDRLRTSDGTQTGSWDVQFGGSEHSNDGDDPVRIDLYLADDDQRLVNQSQYESESFFPVVITTNNDNADETLDEGDPELYWERVLSEAEALLHTPDDGLGEDVEVWTSGATILLIEQGDDVTVTRGIFRVHMRYRRHYQHGGAE